MTITILLGINYTILETPIMSSLKVGSTPKVFEWKRSMNNLDCYQGGLREAMLNNIQLELPWD